MPAVQERAASIQSASLPYRFLGFPPFPSLNLALLDYNLINLPRNIPQLLMLIPQHHNHPCRLHIEWPRSVLEAMADDFDDAVVGNW